MTYYLDSEVRKIKSPIILCVDDQEIPFENGQALSMKRFDIRYAVESITAKDNQIVIVLQEGIESPDPSGVSHTDYGFAD